jgi:hypothetical protein
MGELFCALAGLLGGYYIGVTREWERVLDYLRVHENTRRVWWVRDGIFADAHHRRKGAHRAR